VPEEELHRGLAHLQAAEFLYETSLFPEHAYTFKHALTHEVAYGSLLQERYLACTEQALSLAETLGDPHRLALGVTAVANALNQAGDNVRAFAFAQRGVALAEAVGDLALLVSTRHDLGQICHTLGDYLRAATVLGQTVELLQGDLAHERFGRSLYSSVSARVILAACLAELGEFRQASAAAAEGLRIAEGLQQPASLLIALRGVCTHPS
jgi:tetratricopeptide (TPR) repeat protein